ncbi:MULTISPECIES: hypothetical protein [unclassified Kitasatospora]|uniref:hypothetical protein n=1 Tax=unclassified Kitasatospora TaxID=2633591 RepID=UPI0033DFBDCD
MTKFRKFKANKSGIKSLMKLPEVGAELGKIARRIAASAGSGGGIYKTDQETGRQRIRSAVMGNYDFPAANADRESSRRDLLRGLDGANE